MDPALVMDATGAVHICNGCSCCRPAAIVGRLGTEPLAAVGLSTIVYNFSNFIW